MINVEVLYFEVTQRCNLNCVSCFVGNKHNQELDISDIRNLISLCSVHGLKKVVFSGGEPFLYERIKDLLLIAEQFQKIEFLINTNACCIDQDSLLRIDSNDNIKLQISLDGATQLTNDAVRGKGTYQKVLDFLSKANKSNIKNVNFVINQKNKHEVPLFVELCQKLNLPCRFDVMHPFGFGDNELLLSPVETILYSELINKLYQLCGIPKKFQLCTGKCNTSGKDICLSVKSNGEIFLCVYMTSQNLSMGNIEGIDCWNNLVDGYWKIAKKIQNWNSQLDCNGCALEEKCHNKCIALVGSNNESWTCLLNLSTAKRRIVKNML